VEIEIVNWSNYTARKDVKATSWFRLENRWWRDPKFEQLDSHGKLVWISILSIGSERLRPCFTISPRMVAAILNIQEKQVLEAIETLKEMGCIKLPRISRVTRASRKRVVDVTTSSHGRTATNKQTDKQTNGDHEQSSFAFVWEFFKKRVPGAVPGPRAEARFHDTFKTPEEIALFIQAIENYGKMLKAQAWRTAKGSLTAFIGTSRSGFYWQDYQEWNPEWEQAKKPVNNSTTTGWADVPPAQ
jgi:hypothetical protein